MSETDAAEAKRRAEWLHKHKAHKDWVILSVSEISVIRAELEATERERDEARESLKHITEYGTEEINVAVELRQKLASALVERDEVQKAVNGLCEHIGVSPANTTLLAVEVLRIQREREEAITRRMETIMQCELYEQERDKAREQNAKLRNIAERLFAAVVGRMKANDWRAFRAELDRLKEGAK